MLLDICGKPGTKGGNLATWEGINCAALVFHISHEVSLSRFQVCW
jgi:hypothetical protein